MSLVSDKSDILTQFRAVVMSYKDRLVLSIWWGKGR